MNCYVYAIVVDGVRRYIGKGSGWRVKQHFAIARRLAVVRALGQKVKASYFHNKLSKALKAGSDASHEILFSGLSHEEAFAKELAAIAAEPKGQLWNQRLESGGRLAASPELKKKLSNAAKRRYRDPEQLKEVSDRLRAIATDPAWRAATSERQKRRFAAGDPATKRFREAAYHPEVRQRMAASLKKTLASRPDLRNHVARWRAGHMEEHAASLKAAHARPEVKAKRRAYYDSPEGRSNLLRALELARQKRSSRKAAAVA